MKTITGIILGGMIFLLQACTEKDPLDTSTDAAFSASGYDTPIPCTISFINTSRNSATYLWTFGDGATSTEPNPTHTYTAIGAYYLKLKATGPNGVDSICKVLYLGNVANPAQSSFSYFMDKCTGTPVNFSFFSLNPLSQYYAWDFGNGATSPLKNPIIQFSTPGNYMVKFSSQINGVRDTVSLGIQIF